ncbi:MAG: acyl carrier protein [Gammaproteobacteria bacterium]|jgi:acyl carrier protein
MTIEAQIRLHILQTQLPGEDPEQLQIDDDLLDSGILDSMGIMQLVTYLEKEYGISIPTGEIEPERFASVATLAAFVRSKQRSGTAGSSE